MDEFILKGSPCTFPKIDKGFGEYFFEQAEKNADNVFQIDGDTGKQETYKDVKRRSTRVALYLQKIGLKSKDIVLLCCKNNLDNIVPALAAQYLGALVGSVDPKQTVSDVKHCLELLEPKVLVVEKDSLDLLEQSLKSTNQKPHIITIGSTYKYPNMLEIEMEAQGEENFKPMKQKDSDIAAIVFSSGTTSAPKGIYITNWSLLNIAGPLIQQNSIKVGVIVHFASLYWISAWLMSGVCIVTGTAKVIAPDVKAERFLQLVDKYKVTHMFTSNTYTYQLTSLPEEVIKKYDTSSLYAIGIGGSTMDPNQIIRMRNYFPYTNVVLGYGSSEANYIACHDLTNQKAVREKISSSGSVLPDVQIKLIDLNGTEKPVGPNQEGEIHIKSNFIMSGYHKYSKPDIYDKDGFLKSGDVGYYDQDGYLYVTDRISEMFKYKTNQISPTVLDNIIAQHPAVKEALAFGVPHFVDRNHAAACVVIKANAKVTPTELEEFVNKQVSDAYKLRGGVMILESLPKSATGKYLRRTARDLFIKFKNDIENNNTYNI
ncbi:unnamed protein product [Ceutorhynchus assimilis]|uniref:Uncharacterized protein n=1 Tax=Ceutorhynchus assimilis TaxID=467358 RepID=A0A9N9MQG5_9CUCU|nr:unnamed protein product [Ceutorhynchus assimilis]